MLRAVDRLEPRNIALGFMDAAEPDLSRNSTSHMVAAVLWGCAKEILTTQGRALREIQTKNTSEVGLVIQMEWMEETCDHTMMAASESDQENNLTNNAGNIISRKGCES